MSAAPINREVRADLSCRQCGYNLRGMTLDRSCPECGTPVEFSARGFQLRFADPAWVRRMRSGTNMMLWAVVVFGITLILAVFVGVSAVNWQGRGDIPVGILLVGWCAALSMWWIGIVRVTTVEPRVRDEEPPVTMRHVARVTGLAATLGWVVVYAGIASFDLRRVVGAWGELLCFAISLVSVVALLLHMRKLADRTISGYLRDWITSYLYTATIAAMVVAALVALGSVSGSDFGLCAGCLALIAAVFLSIWMILLLAEFNRELDHCVRYAESESP